MIPIKDINGNYVLIKEDTLMREFSSGVFSIYGLSMQDIHILRKNHLKAGGSFPIEELDCLHDWTYDGHGHNYEVFVCSKCGERQER